MKKFTALIITAVILVISLSFSVFAETPPAYNSMTAGIELNKDGTAQVTETWDITFFGDAEQRVFTRSIENGKSMPKIEQFKELNNFSVILDGKAYTNGSSDEKVAVAVRDTGNGTAADVTFKSSEKNFRFIISYNISGSLKSDDGKARFCFRLIDSQTGTVNNVTAGVRFPSDVPSGDINVNSHADIIENIDNGYISFAAGIIREATEIDVSVPSDTFDKGAAVKYSALSDKFSALMSKLAVAIPVTLIVIALIVISVFSLTGTRNVRKAIMKEASSPEFEVKAELPEEMTLPEAAKLIAPVSKINAKKRSKSAAGLLALGFAQLIRDGFITFSSDDAVLDLNRTSGLADHEKCIAELLIKYASKKNEQLVLDKNSFSALQTDTEVCADYFFNLVSGYVLLLPKHNAKFFRNDDKRAAYASCMKLYHDTSKHFNVADIFTLLADDRYADCRVILPMGTEKMTDSCFTLSKRNDAKAEFANALSCFISAVNRIMTAK